MSRPQLLIALLLSVAVAACGASSQAFEPSERVQGQTLEGDKVAIYPLTAPSGPFGEAKVWSSGAYESGDRTFVHAGFEIHNTGRVPIELRAAEVSLDALHEDDGPIKGLRPIENATTTIAPGAIGESSLSFELPPGVSPGDIAALRLHWRLHAGDQVYAQRTPFVEEVQPRYANGRYGYPCWPYGPYDCMYMTPFGYRAFGPVYVPRYRVDPNAPNRSVVRPKR